MLQEIEDGVNLRGCRNQQVLCTIRWFNIKNTHSFINCNDTCGHIFVHQTVVTWNNAQKLKGILGECETTEFDIVVGERDENLPM